MDIIIFGGQSNMQGQTETLSSAVPIPNAFEYKLLTDSLVPLQNPVGEDIGYDGTGGKAFSRDTDIHAWLEKHVTGSACFGNTNLVPEFCRAYTQTTGEPVVAVHVAKGSTVIADWLCGTPGYEMLLKKSRAAIEKVGSSPSRIFFVWLQGESDAVAGNSRADYKQKITALCRSLKADLKINRFGIIRVGRFTGDARDDEIIAAQDEICEESADFIKLTDITTELCERAEYMNPEYHGHYNARGLETIGRVAGTALGSFVKNAEG